ncbi:unnamed protein product [Rotaria socialis]|uniref:Uncharacterized protein n=1 Tax=Rotaria socialis TaxID=392032 RepID=A0A821RFC6_9BILA|nr:unnamed protein product [Rotaria socialis]
MISQHALFRARALKAHYAIFNKKNALDADTNDTPVVRAGEISKDQATSDETPAWFEPSQPIPSENIRYPRKYNKSSPEDARTYDCLSIYRSIIKKEQPIDFVAESFVAAVDSTETLGLTRLSPSQLSPLTLGH